MNIWDRWCRGRAAVIAVVAVGALVAGSPQAARAEQHKDEKLGYQVSYPKGWLKRPVAVDERWVVAKFECDRSYESADRATGMTDQQRPWIDVVVLPFELAKQKKTATIEKTGDGIRMRDAVEWTNLKEYLEKRLQDVEPGGFFFSKEEEGTVNGYKVQQYEITVEKLVPVPKRVYAWAYATDDAWYCLIGQALVPYESKLKPDILGAFKSFKAFTRTGNLPNVATTGEDITVVKEPGKDESAADREKARKEAFDRRLRRVQESLDGQKDWITKESEHFTAVSHCDAKYTKSVLDHSEAIRDWLDDQLGFLGTGKPGKVLIRICKDQDEYQALQTTGGYWSMERVELVTYRDREGWSDYTTSSLNRSIYSIWLRDKDREISWKMPDWVESGISSLVSMAATKGRKVEFKADSWDKAELAKAASEGKLVDAPGFFRMTSDELYQGGGYRQAPYFVRYLLLGGAQKQPKFKNVLRSYLVELTLALEEDRKKEKEAAGAPPEGYKEPQNEQEEEEMTKSRQSDFRKGEKEFLDRLAGKVFGDWTDSDWDQLTKSYWKEIK